MKKIIFLAIVFISLLLPLSYTSAQLPNLEIVYPRIPGDPTPPTVISEGLPDYVNYIYYFFFAIIGIIVLGALIYNGIIYLTSVGSPDKLMSAKKGIVAAFLGAIILFSSWFVFRSINPQLTILEAEDPALIEPVIPAGIYLCNYKPPNISNIIYRYTNKKATEKEIIDVARDFRKIVREGNNICFRVAFSGNLSFGFNLDPSNNDFFIIPRKEYVNVPVTDENPDGINIEWKYEYGIIFHEKDNFHGKCALGIVYDRVQQLGEIFRARSVTLFEKPEQKPVSDQQQRVTLYQCLNYDITGQQCPSGLSGIPTAASFPAISSDDYMFRIGQGSLGNLASLAPPIEESIKKNINGTRSIQVDEGSYLAVLFSRDSFEGNVCEVIAEDDNNLLDQPIGQCKVAVGDKSSNCTGLLDWNKEEEYLRNCRPCTNSMIVVKGNVVK